jgi:hypothetical protein
MRTIVKIDPKTGEWIGKRHEMVEELGADHKSGIGYIGKTACGRTIRPGQTGGTALIEGIECGRCFKIAKKERDG